MQWVDWFNNERLLEPLGYITPVEAEEKYEQALKSDKIAARNTNSTVSGKTGAVHYDYNNVRPHSSLGKQTPAEARRTLEQFEGSTPGVLAQTETEDYENQTRRLSL